jgi:DNA-binding NarL/FixJ family response regulator
MADPADHPLRVALVEDSPVLRERLVESLESLGGIDIVAQMDSQEEAVRGLQTLGWDALVLDLQLRQGTGLGVLSALQAAGGSRGRTVIVLTNYAFPQYRAKCEQLGADHFLDKSRDWHRLPEILRQLMAA